MAKRNAYEFALFIGFCAILLSALSVAVAETDRVAVFITAPSRDGFVDTTKEVQDSIKDIRSRISHMKEFRVVNQRDNADIVLTVISRGIGSTAYGQRVSYTDYYHGATLTSAPMVANTYWVSAIMDVGRYRKELLGSYTHEYSSSMGAWSLCAEQIAKNLKSWAAENSEQLRQRRNP